MAVLQMVKAVLQMVGCAADGKAVLQMVSCAADGIITFLRTLMNIKGLDPDLGGHLISDPPDPDPEHC
jgi:hypothetical protein